MAIITDENAQWCSTCRDGDHGMCTSSTCECPDARKHRRRPNFGSRKSARKTRRPRRRAAPTIALVDDLAEVRKQQRAEWDKAGEEQTDADPDPEVAEVEADDADDADDAHEWDTLEGALRQAVEFKVLAAHGGRLVLQVRFRGLG
jgi:hypothetical protein